MTDEAEPTMDDRMRTGGWVPDGDGRWRVEADGGRMVGTVEGEAGRYTARVLRHPTGPSGGPETVEVNGPTPFDDLAEAVRYVEANLGLDA